MTSGKDHKAHNESAKADGGQEQPDWANGLRQLYDSVLDEELPESFKELLDQLDQQD